MDNLIHPAIASLSYEPVEEELQSAVIYEHNVNGGVDNIDRSQSSVLLETLW